MCDGAEIPGPCAGNLCRRPLAPPRVHISRVLRYCIAPRQIAVRCWGKCSQVKDIVIVRLWDMRSVGAREGAFGYQCVGGIASWHLLVVFGGFSVCWMQGCWLRGLPRYPGIRFDP